MEIKVGDYVRTANLGGGSIEKIIKIYPKEETEDLITRYVTDISAKFNVAIKKEEIIKSSPNIIDLIEVGDYVNGQYVSNIIKSKSNDIGDFIHTNTDNFYKEDIKTIVTKEQFENMEYKIER